MLNQVQHDKSLAVVRSTKAVGWVSGGLGYQGGVGLLFDLVWYSVGAVDCAGGGVCEVSELGSC